MADLVGARAGPIYGISIGFRGLSLNTGRKLSVYKFPSKKIHRGFFYLNDETVINSLSAVEAGKIDEVVAKVNSASEGAFGGGLGFHGVGPDGSREAKSAFAEEIVRTRTRFSVFELWYQTLIEGNALGIFDGWGAAALEEVKPGHTVEFRATLEVVPIQALFRLYLWFSDKAKAQGNIFSQKGDDLKSTKDAERNIKMLLGDNDDGGLGETVFIARPVGEAGPVVAMPVSSEWLIGKMGRLGGEYTVVAQVDQILAQGEELPTMRLTHDAAATPMEINTLRESVNNFIEPAKAMGVQVSASDASITGPALWLNPIAIFR
ncbi:hypothetical protein [Paenarthrobacter sp. YJN-D]|uniref:DUF6414 family protein n=1 Tax=Paenarthrobacter sp. YJN-D TaxID=2735317 RepID=UPI001878C01F|nr:hypothetical protein [Paenarthrobacter sp. YJN-D]QOT22522.1 hypothetical protein HMI60_13800 [Paenarthrobacter sp. YJN-D]